jgi:hypothetical protein
VSHAAEDVEQYLPFFYACLLFYVNWRTNYNEVFRTKLVYHDLSRLSRGNAHFVNRSNQLGRTFSVGDKGVKGECPD